MKGVEFPILKAFLQFVYEPDLIYGEISLRSNEVEDDSMGQDGRFAWSNPLDDQLADLWTLADRYAVGPLMDWCEMVLVLRLNTENVDRWTQFAEFHK